MFLMRASLYLAALVLGLAGGAWAGSSKPLSVEPGQIFEIYLQSAEKPGYEWQLTKALNPKVVKLLGVDYPRSGPEERGKNREIWRFKALAPGRADIQFKYVRPLLKTALPASSTNFVFIIETKSKPQPSR